VRGVDRTTIEVTPDDVASLLLTSDQSVVVRLADALMIVVIDEEIPVATMRNAVVHDRGFGDDFRLEAALTKRLPS
jgi:hypothetical protein